MPRQELTATQEEKMVDLDVSGPAIDVELPQDGAVLTEVAQETQESVPVVEVQNGAKRSAENKPPQVLRKTLKKKTIL